MKTLLLSLILAALPTQFVKNFDKTITWIDNVVVIAPPSGKTWRIDQLSFAMAEPVYGTSVMVSIEGLPNNSDTRANILSADTSVHFIVPIVGGYFGELRGQAQPITITYPARILIFFSGLPDGNYVSTWTRGLIKEAPEAQP